MQYNVLADNIKGWGQTLGFQQVGITDTDLAIHEAYLLNWLDKKFHGEMHYMEKHGVKRSRPYELLAGTIRIISVRMNYLPPDSAYPRQVLNNNTLGYISRYALGRDYHKVLKKRLQKLVDKIKAEIPDLNYRIFVDSAPVLEKAIAEKAGLGWIGKHTNLINRQAGSWFFLGEIYTDLPLPIDNKSNNHCGKCQACIDICPTKAIIAPYQLDAKRCISYLTIELKTSIPENLRTAIGNHIYGCDDCQLICPWNRFAKYTEEADFRNRYQLDTSELISLFNWNEADFLNYTQGSAIRRISYEQWLRNIAVALGNSKTSIKVIQALENKLSYPSDLVREHILWALNQHKKCAV